MTGGVDGSKTLIHDGTWSDPALEGSAASLAAKKGANEHDAVLADAFGKELDVHHAWVLPFSGYVNAAGYGYCKEPTFAVAQDGWDAYAAFSRLSRGAQLVLAYRGLVENHDSDKEALRYFLKFECGIIVNGNQPY
jgi:hypothetical protein